METIAVNGRDNEMLSSFDHGCLFFRSQEGCTLQQISFSSHCPGYSANLNIERSITCSHAAYEAIK